MQGTEVIPQSLIESKIFIIRGKKVMPDRDLAALYSAETKNFRIAEKLLNSMAPLLLKVRPYDQGFYHFLSGYYALLHGDNKSAIKYMKTGMTICCSCPILIIDY